MAAVTVLGLGPMGRAVARAFAAAGHRVVVWNRTPGRAADLPDVTVAATAAEGVGGADLVAVCLREDAAVDEVLAGIDLAGRTLVNLTSNAPEQSRRRAEWAAQRGARYLTGAILTPTPLMGTDRAVVLYSGARDDYDAHERTLAAFGGTSTQVGPDPGRASAFDSVLLDVFWTATSGIVHALALARAEGVEPAELAPFTPALFAMLPEMMGRFGAQLDAGEFPGDVSTIASAAAGLAHLVDAAESRGLDASLLRASRTTVQQAIEHGHAADGLGRLAEVLGRP